MTKRYSHHYDLKKVAPLYVLAMGISWLFSILIHPFLSFVVFVILTILLFHNIDQNNMKLDYRIQSLASAIHALELKLED